MDDWERQQNEELFRQQASDYMAQHSWHMKEQEARQWAQDNPDVFAPVDYSNPLDVLIVYGAILLVGGCAIYALFATIFGD
ncbi:hypothetical protein AB0958_18610 [Streptomyces sp. NPDC006655]|uniref:hypothetical protein n=1 Tax=Streptomyces sp. NPDC006655 TaxID=3156898 RepID=UPI003453261F